MDPKTKSIMGLIVAVLCCVWGIRSANAQWAQIIGPRISIVWAKDGNGRGVPVTQSRALNLSVWPSGQIACSSTSNMSLLIAKNNEPTRVWEKLGQPFMRTTATSKFPSFDFNDIPADMVSDPSARYRFVMYAPVSSSTQGYSGNVWVHAADPRTIQPNPVTAQGFSSQILPNQGLDTRIQIVWPHDERGNLASVETATRLNITAEVFEHGSLRAIPPDASGKFRYSVSLWVAEGNNSLRAASYSSMTPKTYAIGTQTYTQWTFNDVPVSPGRQYHFLTGATPTGRQDVYPYSSIWTHAQDGRTILPNPIEPPSCIP